MICCFLRPVISLSSQSLPISTERKTYLNSLDALRNYLNCARFATSMSERVFCSSLVHFLDLIISHSHRRPYQFCLNEGTSDERYRERDGKKVCLGAFSLHDVGHGERVYSVLIFETYLFVQNFVFFRSQMA